MAKEELSRRGFSETLLAEKEAESFRFVKRRIVELQETRTDHYGVNLDVLWADADRDYIPHRLGNRGRKAIATDEEKGWRGNNVVDLGSTNWQSDISQANPFIKIQTALAILVDQNPTGVFTATTKKYEATNELIKQLYQRSWEYAKSKGQLTLFVLNLAKYGWAIGRTFPLRIARKNKVLVEYDAASPDKSVYEEKEVVEYNDIMRESLDPRNAWIDDMAKPLNPWSLRDWCWRKVYDMDVAKEEFGKYKNWQYVEEGGVTQETIGNAKGAKREYKSQHLVEVYFYENRIKDLFMVLVNGVPVIIEPLPIADAKGVKKLSCWQAPWNIRHGESPYGIGIYEAIRYDQAFLDRIRNMTVDQLTLSIYKSFFYQGTQLLTETGDITISPGVGKQVLDPKNISWLTVPGPGAEAWAGIEMFRKDVDEVSGITDPLIGQVTGKTAFEIAQAKEAALKRLKNPLENILEALNTDGYITVVLIQMLYSIPETYRIVDQQLIDDYLKEVQFDPELYEREEVVGEDGSIQSSFTAKVYPEFPLGLEKDDEGNLIESKETGFFRVKPKSLQWEGMINIKAQSILSSSKQIDKALELEMYNILIPLLANPPELFAKVAKSIVKLYDKDPRDILPDLWLQDTEEMAMAQQANEPLIVPAAGPEVVAGPGGAQVRGSMSTAPKLTSSPTLPSNPQGIAGKIMSKLSGVFKRV